jgi:hypothetical protein
MMVIPSGEPRKPQPRLIGHFLRPVPQSAGKYFFYPQCELVVDEMAGPGDQNAAIAPTRMIDYHQ